MTADGDRDDADETMTPDRARQLILARRARFMAAALAGIASTGCADGRGDGPGICLSVQPEEPPEPEAGASCLTVDAAVRDGGIDSGPRVCLSLPLTCDGSTPRRSDCPNEDAGTPRDAGPSDGAAVPTESGAPHFDGGGFDGGPQVRLSPPRLRSAEDDEASS